MRYPADPPLITVFGGGGFLGRYVCEMLLKSGARLRLAECDPRRDYFLQPLADVGRLYPMAVDFRHPEAIMRAIDGAEAVISLFGNSYSDSARMRDHKL